jgi:hypothetical protein
LDERSLPSIFVDNAALCPAVGIIRPNQHRRSKRVVSNILDIMSSIHGMTSLEDG